MTAVVDRQQGAAVGAECHLEDRTPEHPGRADGRGGGHVPERVPIRPRIRSRRPCRRARTRVRPGDARVGQFGRGGLARGDVPEPRGTGAGQPGADGQEEPAVRAEGEPMDGLGMAQRLADGSARGDVDQPDRRVAGSDGETTAVGAEGQPGDVPLEAERLAPRHAGGQVPEHDLRDRLGRARRQHPAVGTEGQAQDDRAGGKRRPQAGTRLDIPEVDGAAVIAGGEDLAVGPEGQRRDVVDMRQQRRGGPRRRRIPDLASGARAGLLVGSARVTAGRDVMAVGAESHRADVVTSDAASAGRPAARCPSRPGGPGRRSGSPGGPGPGPD